VKKLCNAGVIDVSESDKRYKKVCLTEKAISQSELIGEKYRKVKAKLYDGVLPEQRELLNETIKKLLKNIEQD
jgi:DNA-binding MarR family transcriptional regulator